MKFASFKSSALKSVGAVSLCVALGAGLVGCGGNGAGGGAVAATVNGQDIMEQTITDYIANFRTSSSLESDEAWGEWMVANGYTPESVREEVIDYYVNQDLYDQAAKEYNVTVEQADIDAAMEETKAMFESDEPFQEALEASSMTEESYIEDVIRPNLLQTKLAAHMGALHACDRCVIHVLSILISKICCQKVIRKSYRPRVPGEHSRSIPGTPQRRRERAG